MIEYAVRARLLASPGVTALVGTKVSSQPLAQGTVPPAITFLVVSLVEPYRSVDDGASLVRERIQIDCWGRTYAEAVSVEAAVASALNGYRGIIGVSPEIVTEIQGAFRQNRTDQFEPETKLHRVIADYFVTAQAA